MTISLKSIGEFGKARARNVAWFAVGVLAALAVSATAQYASSQLQSQPCVLDQAMQDAVNKKVELLARTNPDPTQYFSASSPDSCFGGLSIANLDLSKLIPDPMGLLSVGIDGVIDGLKKAAVGAACSAARGVAGDVIGQYNNAIRDMNGALDVRGRTNQFIDASIGTVSRQVLDGYAMNWKTPTPVNATAGVSLPGVTLPTVPAGATTLLNNNAASAPSYTTAAANQESARLSLLNAQQRLDAAKASGDQSQIDAATSTYNAAAQTYSQAQAQTAQAQTTVLTPTQTPGGSTSILSLGSRLFGQ